MIKEEFREERPTEEHDVCMVRWAALLLFEPVLCLYQKLLVLTFCGWNWRIKQYIPFRAVCYQL